MKEEALTYKEIKGEKYAPMGEYPSRTSFAPTPTDYQRGYAVRYFLQPIHERRGSRIIEVDEATYKRFASRTPGFYRHTFIRWVLTSHGSTVEVSRDIIDEASRARARVTMTNGTVIEHADSTIPGIRDRLHPLEKWSGE